MRKKIIAVWTAKLKKLFSFLCNPHFLLCFGLGWMITNGWAYLAFGLGSCCSLPVLCTVAGAYLTALWFPFTPEKIITAVIAIALLRWFFPDDQNTLAVLREIREKFTKKAKK